METIKELARPRVKRIYQHMLHLVLMVSVEIVFLLVLLELDFLFKRRWSPFC